MTLSQLLLALRARLGVILLTLLVTVATTLAYSLWQPKEYATSTAVVVDVKSLDPVAGTVLPGMLQPGYMATQLDILHSGRVSQRVVKALKLDENEAWRAGWLEADEGKGDFIVWAANVLQGSLVARPSRDSNVIHIGFQGSDPAFITAASNAFAQAFVDVDLELKIAPARQYSIWFDEQTKRARSKLGDAQRALSAYRQKTGIVASDERVDAENTRLSDLTAQYTALQGQILETGSKRASRSAESTAESMNSGLVNGLKADIARLEARLQQNSGNLGANHPQTLRSQAELASLRGQLRREIGQISTAFETAYSIGKQREQQLLDAIEAQKEKVLSLNRQRDELNVLRGDVESAQRAFDSVSQRASQTQLESRASQTNISILSPAAVPLRPSKPRILLNCLVATGVGTLLGLGFALLLELGNRRVRSVEDLMIAMDVPVLASIGPVGRLRGPTPPRRLLGGAPG